MRPSSVSLPVATTTPVARPDTTIVPENAMHSRSPTVALAETGVGGLLRRHRLAGQRRFFGAQVLRLDEPQVRRNLVAGLEEHDVPRNELLRGKHARLAAAHGPRLGGEHVADRIQRLLGPALLDEPEQRVENDDGEDDRRVDPQAQHQLDEAGAEKDVDEDVVELGEEPHQRAPLLALRQAVRPIFLQPRRGLGGVEAFFPVGAEPLHDLSPQTSRARTRFHPRCGHSPLRP